MLVNSTRERRGWEELPSQGLPLPKPLGIVHAQHAPPAAAAAPPRAHAQAPPGRGRGRPKPTPKDVQLWDAILAATAKQQKQQQQHRKQEAHPAAPKKGTPTTTTIRPHAPAAGLATSTTTTTPSAASSTTNRPRDGLEATPPARVRSAPATESSSSSSSRTVTTAGGGGATSASHRPKGYAGAPRKAKQQHHHHHQQRQENTNWASDQRYIAFRGKERETPKPTKPSKLKRVILLERAKADALLQPPSTPTPLGTPTLEEEQSRGHEQSTAPTPAGHGESKAHAADGHPGQSDGEVGQPHGSKETNVLGTAVAPGDGAIDYYDSPPPSPPPGAAQVQSIDATYCKQIISVELNQVAKQLLQELTRFQERMRTKDPDKARSKKRYVCGLREVLRSVERKKAKCVVVTPNIERISSPEGGLFEAVEAIVRKSQQNRIIVIFAMTRTSLGKAISKRLKVAALAILDPSGAEEHYKRVLALAHKGRLDYRRMQKRKSAQQPAHEPGQRPPLHESPRQQQPPLGEVLPALIQGAIEERLRLEQLPESTV